MSTFGALPSLLETAMGWQSKGTCSGMALCPWSPPSPSVARICRTTRGRERGWRDGFPCSDLEGPLESET